MKVKLRNLKVVNGPGGVLCLAMQEEGLLDADPRDYVLLGSAELVTFYGTYVSGGEVESGQPRRVVHRRNLWRYIGCVDAREFWRYGHRTRR